MAGVEPRFLREEAARFRRLACEIVDEHGRQVLIAMADEYEILAGEAEVRDTSKPVEAVWWPGATVLGCIKAAAPAIAFGQP